MPLRVIADPDTSRFFAASESSCNDGRCDRKDLSARGRHASYIPNPPTSKAEIRSRACMATGRVNATPDLKPTGFRECRARFLSSMSMPLFITRTSVVIYGVCVHVASCIKFEDLQELLSPASQALVTS